MQNEVKASKPYMREATFQDAVSLAERLREADLQEIFHSSGRVPVQALLEGVCLSEFANAVVYEGQVVAIFGVVGTAGEGGSPWMLASDDLKKIAKSFLSQARTVAGNMLRRYKSLENHVWAGNEVHIQWLKWMGFQFDAEPVLRGRNSQPYYHFYLKDENV